MAEYYDIASYNISEGDIFLVDTCVWISVLSANGFPGDNTPVSIINSYSNFLEKIHESGTIKILLLGISELYNRFIKNTYSDYLKANNLNAKNFSFKNHFRTTNEFNDAKNFIQTNIEEVILEIASQSDDSFNTSSIKSILQRKNDDFNDSYFLQYCENKKIIFVTNDLDAKNYNDMNVTILTANPNLLSSVTANSTT